VLISDYTFIGSLVDYGMVHAWLLGWGRP